MSTTPLTRRQAILRNLASGLYVVPLRLLLVLPFVLLAELLWRVEGAARWVADYSDDIHMRLSAKLPGLLRVPPSEKQLARRRAQAAETWRFGTPCDD